jgi:hypothetical protein
VEGGSDSNVFRVSRGYERYALRVFRAGKAGTCDREVAGLKAARAAGIMVPAVHFQGLWRECPVLLLSWIEGETIVTRIKHHPWETWKLGQMFGSTQALINRIEAPGELGGSPALPGLDLLCEPLRFLIDECSMTPLLLHLDYHTLNVLTDGIRITGVIDWTNVFRGDPRADVARTTTILRLDSGQIANPLWKSAAPVALARVFEEGWRDGHRRRAGDLSNMEAFYAWAGFLMLKDLGQRCAPAQLSHVRRWAERWEKRALEKR